MQGLTEKQANLLQRRQAELETVLPATAELIVQSLSAEEVADELRREIEAIIPRVAGRVLRRNLRMMLFEGKRRNYNGR
jgi:hypothetical protein